jgi:predicted RNA-binding Zn-ribbon protein involved in translation (DUF1610 family)
MHDTTRVCPNCGGTDISIDRSDMLSWFGLDSSYRCASCDYTGLFPEVAKEDVTDQQMAIKQRGTLEDVDTETGPTRGRILFGVMFLLLGIPSATFASWGTGKLAGLLSLAIGAAIMFEYVSSLNPVN